MPGRYERVNTHDDEPDTPVTPSDHPLRAPNSPPPSFHSRQSSFERRRQNVDPTLADAFDADGDDSDDDEPDDRQRLVRGNSFPVSSASSMYGQPAAQTNATPPSRPIQLPVTGASGSPQAGSRVYGGGIQSDGVFSNMMARPESGEKTVEEMPPVRALPYTALSVY
jgi:hypothetical protein